MLDNNISFTGRAMELHQAGGHLHQKEFELVFPGTQLATRQALKSIGTGVVDIVSGIDSPGVVEIVLAEVLNNVVEHAYANTGTGIISVRCTLNDESLQFEVTDEGAPLPQENLPDGKLPEIGPKTQDLPEGGFGWFLIKELTQDLKYTRNNDRNKLQFSVALDQLQDISG